MDCDVHEDLDIMCAMDSMEILICELRWIYLACFSPICETIRMGWPDLYAGCSMWRFRWCGGEFVFSIDLLRVN